jgi:Vesicle coat complex COPII, subunit SEC24/subunit SFB2/subunit SFB3
MPSVPSATEPNNQPCILYSTTSSSTSTGATTTTTNSSSMQKEIQRPPRSSCSRYIIQDRGNASPRLLQCTTQTRPQNKYVAEQTGLGRMNMGMLCMPLAVPSQDYDNDICLDKECSHDDDKRHDIHHGVEYVPLIWDKGTEEHCDQGKDCTRAEVNPIRCKYCKAYWNPFVTLLSEEKSSSTAGSGISRRRGVVDYICNFCERTNTVSPLEMQQQQSSEFYTLPLTYGSVEYEVGGEYLYLPCQKDRQQQQAEGEIRDMDMGMDDPIGNERGGRGGTTFLFALDGGDWDKFLLYLKVLEYVIEDVKEFWIRQRNLEREILEGVTTNSYKSPRIGFFVMYRIMY